MPKSLRFDKSDIGKTKQQLVDEIEDVRRKEARRLLDDAHLARLALMAKMSASLAHGINQPLAAILANAQTLKRQIHTDPDFVEAADEALSDFIADARRAEEFVQWMSVLMKPADRNDEFIEFNHIVTDTVRMLRSETIFRHINLSIVASCDLPDVLGDRIQLQQILITLLMSAFDAMEGRQVGDRNLSVRMSQSESHLVEVCVMDTGVGLNSQSYQRLLKPSQCTKENGMSMELAVAKRMVRSHGGKLWAQNNDGPGAAFYFTIPVASGTTVAVPNRQQQKDDESDVATVFIVDDDPSVLKAMGALIGATGYAVETFESAQVFMQRDRYHGIGCLLVDLHMPGQSGLDLQTMLNTHKYTMPIIFMSGGGDTSSGVRAIKQGAMDFLSKPIDDEALINTVARAIEADRHGRDRFASHEAAKQKAAKLTKREAEVMKLVVSGLRNRQIADTLGIGEKTVKVHRGHLMHKLGARSVIDLLRISESVADSP